MILLFLKLLPQVAEPYGVLAVIRVMLCDSFEDLSLLLEASEAFFCDRILLPSLLRLKAYSHCICVALVHL